MKVSPNSIFQRQPLLTVPIALISKFLNIKWSIEETGQRFHTVVSLPDISEFPSPQRGFQGQTGVSRHLGLFLISAQECGTFSAQVQIYLLANSSPVACPCPSLSCLSITPATPSCWNARIQSLFSLCPLCTLCFFPWPETWHFGSYGKIRPVCFCV